MKLSSRIYFVTKALKYVSIPSDYAVIKWKDKKVAISFNGYKFTAWHKVDFQLTALPDNERIKLI